MKYRLHIPFVNREDLLRDAVESVRDIGNIHVWADGVESPDIANVTHHALPEMPFTAVMNCLVRDSWNDDVMFFMHNDGFAPPTSAARLLKFVEDRFEKKEKFGVIFTTYDVLCCFNMEAVRAAGYWDTMFFHYVSDCDYYYRLKMAGFPSIAVPGFEIRHRNDASNTNKADPIYNHRVQWRSRNGFDNQYYCLKWGGLPGHEKFSRAFQDIA